LNTGDNVPVQEIVIIRRKHDDGDHGHHGGMWKIAFADFMTAMMAFFLVMWLISASDEKTLDQLATYFNPIKLPDVQKSEKTLQTAGDSGAPEKAEEHKVAKSAKKDPIAKGEEAAKEKQHEDSKEGKQKVADEALFADPYGVLSKLATQVARVPLPVEQGLRKEDGTSASGGAAFRDPFDPDFRQRMAEAQQSTVPQDNSGASQNQAKPGIPANEDAPDEGGDQPAPAESASQASGPSDVEKPQTAGSKVDPGGSGTNKEADAAAGDNAAKTQGPADADATARQLDAEIRETLRRASITDLPDITVEGKSEGILISLTDKLNFEMFNVSSATPRPELVVAMEKIGKLLQTRQESVVVRGHTDSRPFRSASYDNWRLSTDRAQIARYMLVRGGLPQTRFDRVEGHADRELKVPSDPKAAGNRRIEILLRHPMS
jgi:chemotaxis protein MotB